jgi:GYF domain 2
VLRCTCGQFVRMDRALPDARSDPAPAPKTRPSEPAPAPKAELTDTDDSDDEQTHMVDSLAALAALGNKAPRVPQISLSGTERKSQPPPRAQMRSMASEPPGGDKPLWYVDLGGIETVEMTIEQLIIARRSGKLGEGALVWREGMPRWRPVGTLIPATSVASRPTPPPPPPSPPPPSPSRLSPVPPLPPPPPAPILSTINQDPESAPASFGTYERPLATLEFALESPGSAAPRPSPRPAPPPPPAPLAAPAREQRSSQPMRAASPVPTRSPTPIPTRSPTPIPTRSPTPIPTRLPTPVPSRPATPVPQPATWTSTSVVAPLPKPVSSSVAAMSPVTLPPSGPSLFHSERPRWVTASLALLLCVTASSSGAFLVRALRPHRQPLQLAPSPASSALLGSSGHLPTEPKAAAAPEPSPAPQVVDIASLSVEHLAPRPAAHPTAIAPPKAPSAAQASDDSNDSDETEPVPAAAPTTKPKNSDLPAAAPLGPHASGAPDDGAANKAPAPGGDAPGF